MAVLVILLMGTLGIIYGSSYFKVTERNYEMLKLYAEVYSLGEQPEAEPEEAPKRDFKKTPRLQLITFYSIAISDEGEVLATDNDLTKVCSDSELAEIARSIIEGGRNLGIKGSLIYCMADKGDYTLVVFMDNTIMQESMTTLFRYTLVFGGTAVFFMFFFSVFLAKKIVQPLEESYQKQKQFISDAGHELKTPVSVVSVNAELLSCEIGENQWLANIQYENERMAALVEQLLELARTEAVAAQMERVELGRLVGGELLPFESVAFEKGLAIRCEIADKVYVWGNSAQLKQLVGILLDNAIRYSAGGKEIALSLKEERNCAVLTVINECDTISPDQRKQMFERFYRGDTARNGDGRHYGLGLAIAKAIVTAHKGKIGVECPAGKIEFTVSLPLQK